VATITDLLPESWSCWLLPSRRYYHYKRK